MTYKDKFYERYVSAHTGHIYGEVSLENIRSQFVFNEAYYGRFLPTDKNLELLDIGCGNGGFVFWLQERGFKKARGVDLSKEQIEQGEKMGIKNIHLGDFKQFLKDHPDSFDIIFARDVLEHLNKEEVLDLLELIRTALKADGHFVSQTVNAENPLWGRLRHADFTHDLAFTHQSMRQLLLMSGFEDVNVYPQRPVAHGVFSAVRAFLWFVIELALQIYLLIETGSSIGIFTQNIITQAKKAQ